MGKDQFEFGLIASAEEIAEYLTSLAVGLKRGEVTLESGDRALRLTPPGDLKLEVTVEEKTHKGRLEIQIGWKRRGSTKATDLRVAVGISPVRA